MPSEPVMRCELCARRGLSSDIRWFKINLEESILMCSDKLCPYPFGVAEVTIVNTGRGEILNNSPQGPPVQNNRSFDALNDICEQKSNGVVHSNVNGNNCHAKTDQSYNLNSKNRLGTSVNIPNLQTTCVNIQKLNQIGAGASNAKVCTESRNNDKNEYADSNSKIFTLPACQKINATNPQTSDTLVQLEELIRSSNVKNLKVIRIDQNNPSEEAVKKIAASKSKGTKLLLKLSNHRSRVKKQANYKYSMLKSIPVLPKFSFDEDANEESPEFRLVDVSENADGVHTNIDETENHEHVLNGQGKSVKVNFEIKQIDDSNVAASSSLRNDSLASDDIESILKDFDLPANFDQSVDLNQSFIESLLI